MKTTRARAAAVVLAAVVAGTVVGCGSDSDGSAQETTLNPYDLITEPATAPSTTVTSTPPASEAPTDLPHGSDVVTWLTPSGATVVGAQSGETVLMSDDPLDTLVEFYSGVLAQMGAQGQSGREGTAWGYVGTYDGKPIQVQVAVTDESGRCSIIISH